MFLQTSAFKAGAGALQAHMKNGIMGTTNLTAAAANKAQNASLTFSALAISPIEEPSKVVFLPFQAQHVAFMLMRGLMRMIQKLSQE